MTILLRATAMAHMVGMKAPTKEQGHTDIHQGGRGVQWAFIVSPTGSAFPQNPLQKAPVMIWGKLTNLTSD